MTLLNLEPVDRVDVTTLVDNTADMLLPDVGPVRRWGLSGTSGPLPVAPSGVAVGGSTLDFLRAEHGYSALIDVYQGGRMHRVLYDAGVSPFGLVENLDRLGISPDTFQAIVLSHGHFDHVAGLHGLIKRIGVPEVAGPAPSRTSGRAGGSPRRTGLSTCRRQAGRHRGRRLRPGRGPATVVPSRRCAAGHRRGAAQYGVRDRPAARSPGMGGWPVAARPAGPRRPGAGGARPRPRPRDHHRCGHAGIVNIVRQAKRLTGVDQIYLVTGGLHLRDGPVLATTVTALTEEQPQLIVPAHCTSWLAHHALYEAMPQAYQPNSVGSRFELLAAPETKLS